MISLERQRQEDHCEFDARLAYIASCRIAQATTQRNFVSEEKIVL